MLISDMSYDSQETLNNWFICFSFNTNAIHTIGLMVNTFRLSHLMFNSPLVSNSTYFSPVKTLSPSLWDFYPVQSIKWHSEPFCPSIWLVSNGTVWYLIKVSTVCHSASSFSPSTSFFKYQGPVVQSVVSLTSSLVVKILTVLVSTVSNSQVFLLKNVSSFANAKATHIFSAKILAYMPYLMIKVLTIR